MLLAEIHGKYVEAVRDHEDYLTSTVFSHLRYVKPGLFWSALFSKAKTLEVVGEEVSLTDEIGVKHTLIKYSSLKVDFWPTCAGLGVPELSMIFTGGNQKPLVVLVEVKLWSGKSGQGKRDQLMRYLRIADAIDRLKPAVPVDARIVVLYLTPREAVNEVRDSLTLYGDSDVNRRRLFRLQWQDMIDAISEAMPRETDANQLILNDVRDFLRVRGLEYFRGFQLPTCAESLGQASGKFFSAKRARKGEL